MPCCPSQRCSWTKPILKGNFSGYFDNFFRLTPELKAPLSQLCMYAHVTIEQQADKFYKMYKRKVYTTPKSYIDLITSYITLLKEKNDELRSYKNKLASGLTKLTETNETVKDLEANLVKLEPVLKQKTVEQEALIRKIEVDKGEANKVRLVVEGEERIVNEKKKKIQDMKEEADRQLNEALPVLNAARDALSLLSRQVRLFAIFSKVLGIGRS